MNASACLWFDLTSIFSKVVVFYYYYYFFLLKGMRSGEVPAGGRGQFPQNSTDHQPPRLTKSRTSLELNNNSTRAANNKVAQQGAAAATVTSITIQKQPVNEATASPAGQFVLQRSKSSGSHLTLQQQKVPVPTPASTNATPKVGNSELPDVSSFPEAAQILLRKIAVGKQLKQNKIINMNKLRIF
jgi:hypothetical protein